MVAKDTVDISSQNTLKMNISGYISIGSGAGLTFALPGFLICAMVGAHARAGTTKKLALPTSESCSFSNMPWVVVVVGVVWNVRVTTIMCARV